MRDQMSKRFVKEKRDERQNAQKHNFGKVNTYMKIGEHNLPNHSPVTARTKNSKTL